jgi:hypothetical protein
LPTPHPALADTIWLTDKGRPDVPPFTGGADAGKARFQLAIRDVDILLDNYDALARSGGDTVRLYLGTQGVKSNMFGIMKVLKSLKEEADDIVEYTEGKERIIYLQILFLDPFNLILYTYQQWMSSKSTYFRQREQHTKVCSWNTPLPREHQKVY